MEEQGSGSLRLQKLMELIEALGLMDEVQGGEPQAPMHEEMPAHDGLEEKLEV